MNNIVFETSDKVYRILEIRDDHISLDDLKGDCFNPEVNSDIDPEKLKREELAFEKKVYNEGVYGYVLEKWNSQAGMGYEEISSCWGFVGSYDPNSKDDSHYIVDELKGYIK